MPSSKKLYDLLHNKTILTMKNILVPTDFSEISFLAAKFAMEIAKASNAKLIILHSFHLNINLTDDATYDAKLIIEETLKTQDKKLQSFQKKLGDGVEIKMKLSNLSLTESIKNIIDEEEIDLVVMATEGASGLYEKFIGSKTEKVVRKVGIPVIAVPSPTSMDSIHNILVPLDIREIQDKLMKNLLLLQEFFSAKMEFVWVRTPHNIENEETVREKFNSLMDTYGIVDCKLSIIYHVFPLDGILQYAEESKADMLAMATHARRGISHLLAGSITEDTINHIHIPVWTYKLAKDDMNIDYFELKNSSKELEKT